MSSMESIFEHDGQTSRVQISTHLRKGIVLRVNDPHDTACGQVILKVMADGYEICLQTKAGEASLPFVTWPGGGQRMRDILPAYRGLLSPGHYDLLHDTVVGDLRLAEFKKLLQKAVAYDADGPPRQRKRWQKRRSLYRLGLGIGPKTIAALAAVFLTNDTSGRGGD